MRSNRSLRAHFTAKSKRLPVRVYTPVLSFSDAPKHECSEGARVRLNSSPPGIGKWEDPSMNAAALRQPGGQAPVPGQSLDEWEFVWCLRADLSYQNTSDRFCSCTASGYGFPLRSFLVVVGVICRVSTDERALLDRSPAPSDVALCAPTHQPFWILFSLCGGYF